MTHLLTHASSCPVQCTLTTVRALSGTVQHVMHHTHMRTAGYGQNWSTRIVLQPCINDRLKLVPFIHFSPENSAFDCIGQLITGIHFQWARGQCILINNDFNETTVGDIYNRRLFFERHIESNVLYLQNVHCTYTVQSTFFGPPQRYHDVLMCR